MSDTTAAYDRNAAQFFADTVALDMTTLHERFLAALPPGGLILDAGCGSGRDTKAFLARGYRVKAFDPSVQLAGMAAEDVGQPVIVRRFADVTEEACYDGIWACASLLHVSATDLPDVLLQLWRALKPARARP